MQHHFCDQPVFAECARFIEKRKPDFRTVETEQIKPKGETLMDFELVKLEIDGRCHAHL